MNKVESYQFGRIVINGKMYDSDVIIFPDRVQDDWWRENSHKLSLEEAGKIFAEHPEVLVVGTGAFGRMKVLSEVQQAANTRDIQLVVQPTSEACETFNRLSPSRRAVVAALHLTC